MVGAIDTGGLLSSIWYHRRHFCHDWIVYVFFWFRLGCVVIISYVKLNFEPIPLLLEDEESKKSSEGNCKNDLLLVKLTDVWHWIDWLAQSVEQRRTAVRENAGSDLGRTNTQGFYITEENVRPS